MYVAYYDMCTLHANIGHYWHVLKSEDYETILYRQETLLINFPEHALYEWAIGLIKAEIRLFDCNLFKTVLLVIYITYW